MSTERLAYDHGFRTGTKDAEIYVAEGIARQYTAWAELAFWDGYWAGVQYRETK